jgi:hypothetical protein
MTPPSIGHIVIARKTDGIWSIQPFLHLIRRLRGIRHASLEVVEVISQQEEMVMRFPFDNLVDTLYFVMNVGEDKDGAVKGVLAIFIFRIPLFQNCRREII